MKSPLLLVVAALLASPAVGADSKVPLLQPEDRVALVGATLVERARLYGHLEAALHTSSKVENVVIRNFGWSGDSVFGDSRAYFGPPREGRDRLDKVIAEFKPTVVLLCYGTGEAMSVNQGWTDEKEKADESAGGLDQSLSAFIEGYQGLLDRLEASAGDSLREVVLISPPPLENLGEPMPDQSKNNERLSRFRDAIKELSKKNDARFVDLFRAMGGDDFSGETADPPLTTNGVHYSEAGYRLLARELVEGLGYPEPKVLSSNEEAAEELLAAVVEKNRLFFHRWRPVNETYLFLFRKHEQGQNAKEIPMFDPLVAEQDARIEAARKRLLGPKAKN